MADNSALSEMRTLFGKGREAMKLVRYGERGAERPGLIDANGALRDPLLCHFQQIRRINGFPGWVTVHQSDANPLFNINRGDHNHCLPEASS